MLKWMKSSLTRFWKEEDGIGTLEMLLIIAVIVIIAIAFRKWIVNWVKKLFDAVGEQVTDQTNAVPAEIDKLYP